MNPLEHLQAIETLVLDPAARFGAQDVLSELANLLTDLQDEGAPARDQQRCLHLIHLVNFKIERFEEAFDYGYRALKTFPEIHHLSLNAPLMLPYRMGECCLKLGHFEEAVEYYGQTLHVLEAQSSDESDAKLGTIEKIGYCLHEAGRFEDAYANNQSLLARGEKFFGPQDPVLGSVLINLANNSYELGEFPEAQAYLERAYEVCATEPERAYEILFQLGVLCAETGKTEKAMEYFQRQLAMAERLASPDHIDEAWQNIQMLKAGVA